MTGRARLALAIFIVAALGAFAVLVGMRMQQGGRPDSGSKSVSQEKHARDMERRLAQLRSVPYTALSQDEVGAEQVGVTIFDRARAYPGYNLYCSQTEHEVYLMDMAGKVVHTWTYQQRKRMTYRNHAIMLDGGYLVVINEPRNVQKLDWQSNLVWKLDIASDHDVVETPDGSLYLIAVETKQYRGLIVKFPSIVRLDRDAKELERWSAYDHLDEIRRAFDTRSSLDAVIDSMEALGEQLAFDQTVPGRVDVTALKGKTIYDYLHMNTISLLPDNALGRTDSRFAAGNLLVCFRNINQIAVLQKDTKEILWTWGEGALQWPHHPTMLENGNILIFDNGVLRGYSRVIELDPRTASIEWEYVGSPPESFYSYTRGSAQRLPNGNTLVCEGDRGVAFEVTRGGEMVWRWVNPATKMHHRVLVYRMERLPAEIVEPLLTGT